MNITGKIDPTMLKPEPQRESILRYCIESCLRTEDVSLIRKTVAGKAPVKASGGIRSCQQAVDLTEAGADRIGAGNGMVLLER